jgi:uncharacterized protein
MRSPTCIEDMMTTRSDIRIPAEGNITLAGQLYLPEGEGPHPAVTMAHGFGGIKEQGLGPYAEAFCAAGFVVLRHDHRGFGESEGTPRGDINPWQQITDWRQAISYLETRPEADAGRIGIWGTSYAGGHATVLGATDRRIKAVVAQVPATDGTTAFRRRVPPHALSGAEEMFLDDDRQLLETGELTYLPLVSDDPSIPAFFTHASETSFYHRTPEDGKQFENRATVRSMRWSRMYVPGAFAEQVSPTPLMMIVATEDNTTATDLALRTYESALEPKQLVLVPGDHFDPYLSQFPATSSAAINWLSTHL